MILSKHKARGFTLIELMTVVAIIGILASVISVSLVSSRAKGRDAQRVADIKNIQLALETYFNDNGYYPLSIYSGGSPAFSPTYLTTVPKDPKDNTTQYKYSSYISTGSSNCGAANPIRYHLGAAMESDDGAIGAPGPKNTALLQDNDWAGWSAYTPGGNACTNAQANFNGTSVGCALGNTPGAYDSCYDVTY